MLFCIRIEEEEKVKEAFPEAHTRLFSSATHAFVKPIECHYIKMYYKYLTLLLPCEANNVFIFSVYKSELITFGPAHFVSFGAPSLLDQ